MSTNNIDIVVSDKGVAESAERVIQLADASERAEGTIVKLKAALADVKAGGIANLKAALADATSGATSLRSETASLTRDQQATTQASNAATGALKQQKQAAADLALAYHDAVIENRAYGAQARATASAALAADRQLASSVGEVTAALERQLGAQAAAANTEYITNKLAAEQAELAMINDITAAIEAQLATQAELKAASDQSAAMAALQAQKAEANELALAYHDAGIENRAFNAQIKLTADQALASDRELLAEINLITAAMEKQIATQLEFGEVSAASTATAKSAYKDQVAGLAQLSMFKNQDIMATEGQVSANVSAGASFALLEGRTMGTTRAAANFATKILGLGEILQAAFAWVVGPLALVVVLGTIYNKLDNDIQKVKELPNATRLAWNEATDAVISANLRTETEIDKLLAQVDKLNKRPGENGLQVQMDAASEAADRLGIKLDADIKKSDELLKKNQTTAWQRFLGAGDATDVVGAVMGDDRKLQKIKNDYDQVFEAIRNNSNLTTAEKTDQINRQQVDELTSLQTAYKRGDDYLKSLIQQSTRGLAEIDNGIGRATGATFSVGGKQQSVSDLKAIRDAASEAYRLRQADQQGIGQEYAKSQLTQQADGLKVLAAQTSLTTAAAKKEWKEVLDQFTQYKLAIQKTGRASTDQDSLNFFTAAKPKLQYKAENDPKADAQISADQNKILNATFTADSLAKLKAEAEAMDQYGNELRETTMLTKFQQDAQDHKHPADEAQIKAAQDYIKTIVEGKPAQADLNNLIKQAGSELTKHTAYQNVANDAAAKYPQFSDQIARAVVRENEAYKQSSDTFYQLHKAQDDQMALSKLYGQQLQVETQLQAVRNQQLAGGVVMSEQQLATERARITAVIQSNELQSAENALYYNKIEALRQLQVQQQAINDLAGKPGVNPYDTARQTINNQSQQNDINDDMGKGKNSDYITSMLAGYVKLQSTGQQVRDQLKQSFSALADGVADTFAKALVTGKGLWDGLKNAGQQALEGLLSGLLKIGIQLLVLTVLTKLFPKQMAQMTGSSQQSAKEAAAGTAASIASILAVTAVSYIAYKLLSPVAWDLAEAVSLISFGANAIPAAAGIASVVAAGQSAQKLRAGGEVMGSTGQGIDMVPLWGTPGEYMLNTSTVARMGGAANLDRIQAGSSMVQTAPPASSGNNNSKSGLNMEVHNYSGMDVKTEQMTDGRVRMIIGEEAPGHIAKHAPGVIAADIANPNGVTSKSLSQNTTVARSY